jgi:hypothetical protein
LALNVDIDPRRYPILRWRWKVPRPIPGADNTRRETDDAPARIQLAFAGDVSSLPFGERLFFTQVKATAGFDVPYATLEYSWAAVRLRAASSSINGPAGSVASSCAVDRRGWGDGCSRRATSTRISGRRSAKSRGGSRKNVSS